MNRGSANKLTNLQEQSKPSNNQINTIQSAPLNNGNNHDNISSDNSEIQSLNNTLSATMDEKQKMLLLKIANNSIAAASAVASAADNDYGNVSASLISSPTSLLPIFYSLLIFWCFVSDTHFCRAPSGIPKHITYIPNLIRRFVYLSFYSHSAEFSQFQLVKPADIHTETWLVRYV